MISIVKVNKITAVNSRTNLSDRGQYAWPSPFIHVVVSVKLPASGWGDFHFSSGPGEQLVVEMIVSGPVRRVEWPASGQVDRQRSSSSASRFVNSKIFRLTMGWLFRYSMFRGDRVWDESVEGTCHSRRRRLLQTWNRYLVDLNAGVAIFSIFELLLLFCFIYSTGNFLQQIWRRKRW